MPVALVTQVSPAYEHYTLLDCIVDYELKHARTQGKWPTPLFIHPDRREEFAAACLMRLLEQCEQSEKAEEDMPTVTPRPQDLDIADLIQNGFVMTAEGTVAVPTRLARSCAIRQAREYT